MMKRARRMMRLQAKRTFRRSRLRLLALGAGVFLAMAVLMVAEFLPAPLDVEVGQVAQHDIVAPRRVIDQARTAQAREELANQAVRQAAEDPANFQINVAAALAAGDRVDAVRSALAELGRPQEPMEESEFARLVQEARMWIRREVGVDLPSEALRLLLAMDEAAYDAVFAQAKRLATQVMQERRIDEAGLQDARSAAADAAASLELNEETAYAVGAIAASALEPNLVIDPRRLDEARQAAVREVTPIYVEQGQIVVRRGDQINAEHLAILSDLGLLGQDRNWLVPLGAMALLLILLALFAVYIYRYERSLADREPSLLLLGLVLVLGVGMAKIATFLPWEGAVYAAPVALSPILIAMLLGSQLALMGSLFLGAMAGLLTGLDLRPALVVLVSGVAGVYGVSKVSQRGDLARAGAVVGVAGAATMLGLGLYQDDMILLRSAFLAGVGGILSAVLAIGLLPYLESAFGITSAIRLLELSNPNHPLLRRLLMEAPGTYHHSIIVGNLAEAAVEEIGGDPLLTRVGCLFHDIGKIKRPYFFSENQLGRENPHDKIAPSLSTLIITSHVKDGAELARRHKLPQVIIDFILQHHGTDLVKYFYHRAVESQKGEVDETDFRYPGPKPQSKEAAVVMLADSVEAAVRSMPRPTRSRIEGMVHKIIMERLKDGQLDECEMTMREIDRVRSVFVRILTGIFHSRVEYPQGALGEEARRA